MSFHFVKDGKEYTLTGSTTKFSDRDLIIYQNKQYGQSPTQPNYFCYRQGGKTYYCTRSSLLNIRPLNIQSGLVPSNGDASVATVEFVMAIKNWTQGASSGPYRPTTYYTKADIEFGCFINGLDYSEYSPFEAYGSFSHYNLTRPANTQQNTWMHPGGVTTGRSWYVTVYSNIIASSTVQSQGHIAYSPNYFSLNSARYGGKALTIASKAEERDKLIIWRCLYSYDRQKGV